MTNLEIEAFLASAECGSFTEASKKLFVSQSALSRRINALEGELGYVLLKRSKGRRFVELTEQGKAFVSVARKWQLLWRESMQAALLENENEFKVSGVSSLLYFLTPLFQEFIGKMPRCRLNLGSLHSLESHTHIENGLIDLALVTDVLYTENVEIIPLYREPMCLVTGSDLQLDGKVDITTMDIRGEILAPWSNEFDSWHDYIFGTTGIPKVRVDQTLIIGQFDFIGNTWAILPVTVADKMVRENTSLTIHQTEQTLPHRTVYAILGRNRKEVYTDFFLDLLMKHVKGMDKLTILKDESE